MYEVENLVEEEEEEEELTTGMPQSTHIVSRAYISVRQQPASLQNEKY